MWDSEPAVTAGSFAFRGGNGVCAQLCALFIYNLQGMISMLRHGIVPVSGCSYPEKVGASYISAAALTRVLSVLCASHPTEREQLPGAVRSLAIRVC